MEEQTPTKEGEQEVAPHKPTPEDGMSPNDSAPQADQNEAKPEVVQFAERVLDREFESVEEAEKSIRHLKSLVGDQTTSKQRKALEKIAKQANLTVDELVEYADTVDVNKQAQDETPLQEESTAQESPSFGFPDDNAKRLVRIEVKDFLKDVPEAASIKDTLFAEALATNKPVQEIWETRYAQVYEAGKKRGAKKLQTTIEGQPMKATSEASSVDDTRVDFKGMSSSEMEKYLGYKTPAARL